MTVRRITEAAHVDLTGGLDAFVRVDTHLGLVAQSVAASGQWALTPVDVTSGSVSAGTAWTPATPPLPWDGVIRGQALVPLGAGRAVYVRTWVDVFSVPAVGEWTELFVLTTDGSTVTVDSDTNLNTDLGLPGQAFGVTKTAALAVLLGLTDASTFSPVTTFHRVDISSGSIAISAAVGVGGGIFVADDYTVDVGSGTVSALDGTGAVITTLAHPVASPSYLPFTSNTGAIVGSTMAGPPGYALITLDPLSVDASGGPITSGAPALTDGPVGTAGVQFAQITGAPAGQANYFWHDTWPTSAPAFPPGDEAWEVPGVLPDIATFSASPLLGWITSDVDPIRPASYVDGALGSYIDKVTQLFWPQGVGDNTVVVAYTHSSTTTVAVFTVGALGLPVAHLTVTPSTGAGPLTVTADATASTASVALVATGWDFGDGTVTGGGLTKVHTYIPPATSTFTVVVTVFDWFQQSASTTATVHVTVVPKTLPPLRQYPRDDALGGAPRQGHANGATSIQSSARQGWRNTYR